MSILDNIRKMIQDSVSRYLKTDNEKQKERALLIEEEDDYTAIGGLEVLIHDLDGEIDTYKFCREIQFESDESIWIEHLESVAEKGFIWPARHPEESPIEYIDRLSSLDEVEKKMTIVMGYAKINIQGYFEYSSKKIIRNFCKMRRKEGGVIPFLAPVK